MHIPVLVCEIVDLVGVRSDGIYLDVTAGEGGHARALLEKMGPAARLILSDRDSEALSRLGDPFHAEPRCQILNARFSELFDILEEKHLLPITGLLADLGVSTYQLFSAHRGFSFQLEGPLDMRMDSRLGETAFDVLSKLGEKELADLIFKFGEERHSKKIAGALKRGILAHTLRTTGDLKNMAERVLAPFYRKQKIHPATRVFQALRIFVNQELEELEALLQRLPDLLAVKGRAAFISFHSLEDRLVKRRFQSLSEEGWNLITKKPIVPGDEEKKRNPRSRSAKLRVIERC